MTHQPRAVTAAPRNMFLPMSLVVKALEDTEAVMADEVDLAVAVVSAVAVEATVEVPTGEATVDMTDMVVETVADDTLVEADDMDPATATDILVARAVTAEVPTPRNAVVSLLMVNTFPVLLTAV